MRRSDNISAENDDNRSSWRAPNVHRGRQNQGITARRLDQNFPALCSIGTKIARARTERRKGGKVIFISSFNQEVPNGSQGAYSITKSAIKMLAKTMALELAEYNINVIPIDKHNNKVAWNTKQMDIKVVFTLEHENGRQRVFEGILKEA